MKLPLDAALEEYYEIMLQTKLSDIKEKIIFSTFSQEEIAFFKSYHEIREKGFPDLAKKYLDVYFKQRDAYFEALIMQFKGEI